MSDFRLERLVLSSSISSIPNKCCRTRPKAPGLPDNGDRCDTDMSPLTVETSLAPPPAPPKLLLDEAGEILDLFVGDKDVEVLRAGNELIADEVENKGMVGEGDRSEL